MFLKKRVDNLIVGESIHSRIYSYLGKRARVVFRVKYQATLIGRTRLRCPSTTRLLRLKLREHAKFLEIDMEQTEL